MRYFSGCAGIGGFELAIQKHVPDAECVGYSEINPHAIRVYEKHFPEHENYGDITKIDTSKLPDFDLFVGGFPCQAFSVSGRGEGFNDPRGTIFFEFVRILFDKRPRHFLFENVKGLVGNNSGKTYASIIEVLALLDYRVEVQLLNSKDFGVPQNRERVFFVGHLGADCGSEILSFGESTDRDSASVRSVQHIRGRAKSLSGCLSTRGVNAYDRQDLDCLILDYENDTVRRPTPLEYERLQGFPDGWTEGLSDTQRYFCCGNAVSVPPVAALIEALKPCLYAR